MHSFKIMLIILTMLVVLTACVFIYMFTKRLLENSIEKKKSNYLAKTADKWYSYLIENENLDDELIPHNKLDIQFVEELFNVYLRNFKSPTLENNISHFANTSLSNYYQKLIERNKWGQNMHAFLHIYEFKIDRLYDMCLQLDARSATNEEKFQLLRISSLRSPELFLNKLVRLANTLSEIHIKNLLLSINEPCFTLTVEKLDDLEPFVQFSVIDILSIRGTYEHLHLLEQRLQHQNSEIRIRALKTINVLGLASNLEHYLPFMTSDRWEERLMLSKVLQHFPLDATIHFLTKLTEDEHFLVRKQACETIKKDKNGIEYLKKIIESSTDHYAIDAAYEVLTR